MKSHLKHVFCLLDKIKIVCFSKEEIIIRSSLKSWMIAEHKMLSLHWDILFTWRSESNARKTQWFNAPIIFIQSIYEWVTISNFLQKIIQIFFKYFYICQFYEILHKLSDHNIYYIVWLLLSRNYFVWNLMTNCLSTRYVI